MLRKDVPKVKKYTLSLDSLPKVKKIYIKLRKYAEGILKVEKEY